MCFFHSRYCEFLLAHTDISIQSARVAHAAILSSQLTQLLRCTRLVDSLSIQETTPTSLCEVVPTILCDIMPTGGPSPDMACCQQVLRFISIASQSVLSRIEAHDKPTDVISNMDHTLRTASESLEPSGDIDLSPVGVPTLVKPFVASRSEVIGRGSQKSVKKAGKPARDCDGTKVQSTRLVGVKSKIACARARCLLAGRQTMLAQQVLKAALMDMETEPGDHYWSLVQAELHYFMGVATAQRLEEGAEQEEVWFEGTLDTQLHKQCVEEFMQCYQLCFPVMPTILLRETCLWLALLLAEPSHTHHFLSLSQHIALMHETILSLGKKLRLVDPRGHLIKAIPINLYFSLGNAH